MSSFVKASFIHDETAPSESLVLLLKLQPTTSSLLLPRFLHSPSLSMHRLLCAWPPPEADRDCWQRKHLQISHNGWMENGMDPLFWLQVFQKGSAVETSWTPPHKEKILMQSACAWCVCARSIVIARVQSCSHALILRLVTALGRLATAPRARRAGGATPGPAHAPGRFAKAGQARLRSISAASWSTAIPGFEQWQSRTLALDPNFESFFKINFPFLWKMCDLGFSIRN